MSEAAQTLDGWYVLHDFRKIDWSAWRAASEAQRHAAMEEVHQLLEQYNEVNEARTGSTTLYSIVGQKADFVIMHCRETLEDLYAVETAFNKTLFATLLTPTYSYVSVVELSNYLAGSNPDVDPYTIPEVVARLKPELPKTKYICFYPMNKRRSGNDNWYMLTMDDRKAMMRSHGMIGRKYAGIVKQIISGSIGLDNWEWGVTLFADDSLQFKKLVYEMRFDEVSARYGDFGDFYVGHRLERGDLDGILAI